MQHCTVDTNSCHKGQHPFKGPGRHAASLVPLLRCIDTGDALEVQMIQCAGMLPADSLACSTRQIAHLGTGVGVRKAELTPGHVMLFQTLEEAGDVQAQAAHDLAHKLVADAWDVGVFLDL